MRDPLPAASPNFAAVLLAGGRSTRMGFDKATLLIDGQPLWQRQLATLQALNPHELLISGRRDGPYAAAGVEIIEDDILNRGPLGGIASVLRRAKSELVLILAIDLPAMTTDYLRQLIREASPVAPRLAGRFEPLAAVYPKAALPIAEELLRAGQYSMQEFLQRLLAAALLHPREVAPSEAASFFNLNRPEDLPGAPLFTLPRRE